MITLALAQMVYFFCLEAPFTGGEDGIQQVPRGHLFGFIDLSNDMTMYWVVSAVFLGGFLLVHRIIHSPFGQVLKGIRENEPRATSLGYRTDDYKLIAFVLSCTISGVAGGTKALVFGIATLDRRALLDLGRGRADDAAGRAGHGVRAGGGGHGGDGDGELPGAVRRMGDGDAGRDLHDLRAGVSARDRRRAGSVPENLALTMTLEPAPFILTLMLDRVSQDHFDALRSAHFPANRLFVGAHVTLFHALPSDVDVAGGMAEAVAGEAPFPVQVTGLRFLGRGVAYVLESVRLLRLRDGLRKQWMERLTPQDRQKWQPHVTIQNKADPAVARALHARLSAGFEPYGVTATGLALWIYRGGPWEEAGQSPFRA